MRVTPPPTIVTIPPTIDVLPLSTLRQRALEVRGILRAARRRLGAVGGLAQLDAALDATEALLPGLMDRTDRRLPLVALVRRLRPTDRAALKRAARSGGAIDRTLARELADVAPRDILDAIERVELCDELSVEVMAVLRTLEHGGRMAS